MAMTSVYEANAIKDGQIRVLCLNPGLFDDPLHGHLDVINLEDVEACQPDLDLDPWAAGFDDGESIFRHWRDLYRRYFDIVAALKSQRSRLLELISATERLCREREQLLDALGNYASLEEIEPLPPQDAPGPIGDLTSLAEDWLCESRETSLKLAEDFRGDIRPLIGPVFDPFMMVLPVLMIKTAMRRDELVMEVCSGKGYEAVSYAWGPPDMTESITLENSHTELAITPALHDVLRQLRLKDRTRRLWVDAVCINQSDGTERTQQVLRMADVFSAAARVIVSLGREEDNTDSIAMCAIANCHIKDQFNLTFWAPYKCRLLCGDLIYCSCCGKAVAPYGAVNDLGSPIRRLSLKPWFKRMWVVQEVAVARHVEITCGAHRLPWSAISAAARFSDVSKLSGRLNAIRAAQALHATPYSPYVLLRMLIDTADKDCSDARDRIFAIQDMIKLRSSHEALEVGYHMSVEEVFTRVVKHCLLSADSLDPVEASKTQPGLLPLSVIFALVGTEKVRKNNPPSWVPDFHTLSTRSQVKAQEYAHYWSQQGHNEMVCTIDSSTRRLRIRGRNIALLTSVLEDSDCVQDYPGVAYHPQRNQQATEEREIYSWFDRCRQFAGLTWTNDLDFDFRFKELFLCADRSASPGVYLRRMVGSIDWLKLAKSDNFTRDDILRMLCDKVHVTRERLSADDFARWTCEGFLRGVTTFTELGTYDRDRNLSAMQTQDAAACLGWIPKTGQAGDVVCTFVGASRPLLLHPEEDGTFQLLGDCWVHGFDDVRAGMQGDEGLEWFTLR